MTASRKCLTTLPVSWAWQVGRPHLAIPEKLGSSGAKYFFLLYVCLLNMHHINAAPLVGVPRIYTIAL